MYLQTPSTVGVAWLVEIETYETKFTGNGSYKTGPNGNVIEIKKDQDSEGIVQYFIRCIRKVGQNLKSNLNKTFQKQELILD